MSHSYVSDTDPIILGSFWHVISNNLTHCQSNSLSFYNKAIVLLNDHYIVTVLYILWVNPAYIPYYFPHISNVCTDKNLIYRYMQSHPTGPRFYKILISHPK